MLGEKDIWCFTPLKLLEMESWGETREYFELLSLIFKQRVSNNIEWVLQNIFLPLHFKNTKVFGMNKISDIWDGVLGILVFAKSTGIAIKTIDGNGNQQKSNKIFVKQKSINKNNGWYL